ncbi:TrkA family potassium uptake protein [Quadrisphaera sp. DSM 44207]|uniref:potassium channel family protein n=1 Tax=Quadrisphaera sp. DSM 44207 TaxID=1881057 RepID=UPI00088E163F|nr:potassium channel family protein [Quadrisphaera sp. DSM 44207]SDQ03957.1 voltage-gated potassium channel [Quadrisphaera sp. DSM 44207]
MALHPSGLRLPPGRSVSPVRAILLRFALALLVVAVNWGLVLLERSSYTDNADGEVSVIDALYYTTVTLSTTGYGDITPVTQGARLLNAVVVTPMRLLFVIILVGTTIQALTERSRTEFRLARWRARMQGHVVVLGYGTKGRNAVRALRMREHPRDRLVVVESHPQQAAQASADGYVVVVGDATRPEVLREARAEHADVAIVALDRDDTAVLATLTLRRLAPGTTVVAAAREAQNADLLRQSGASSVVVSSETAGRLLGLATDLPHAVGVVEDLLSFGAGLDLAERAVQPHEVGRAPAALEVPVVAVVRAGRVLHYNAAGVGVLQAGDRILHVAATDRAPSRH